MIKLRAPILRDRNAAAELRTLETAFRYLYPAAQFKDWSIGGVLMLQVYHAIVYMAQRAFLIQSLALRFKF